MKILKRYYAFVFIIAIVIGILVTDISRSKFAVIKTADVGPSDISEDAGETGEEIEKVNLNTASKRLLMTLEGVGEKTAERIMAYRDENGGFETAEDIMKVSGIGYDKFLKLKEYITVE